MKKVLILTVTAGGGHNSAARAMKACLENEGYEVLTVDIYKEFASRFNRWLVDTGYNVAVSRFLRLYNAFYERYRRYPVHKALVSPAHNPIKRVYGGLLKIIYEFRPDVIYATSYHSAIAVADLKRAYPIPAKVVTCMLDYVVSPFWESAADGVDKICLADKSFYDEIIFKGYNFLQTAVTGIPVKTGGKDKRSAREELGFKDDRFTVLIMFGGGYWGSAYPVFKAVAKGVKKPVRIIVVNGHDEKGRRKIAGAAKSLGGNTEVINLGYCGNVPTLMSASDILVGKSGGLTVTESVNCRLPLISTAKLAAQEYHNSEYLIKRGAAEKYKNRKELVRLLNEYIDDPDKAEQVRLRLGELNTDGLQRVAGIIEKFPAADYGGVDTEVDFSTVNGRVKRERKKAYRHAKILYAYEKRHYN